MHIPPTAAFVPAGPLSQLEMFFHAVEQIKLGRERVRTMHYQTAVSSAVLRFEQQGAMAV